MKVLVGCESSGKVREAFRKKGHDAYSCDIKPAEDGSPYHIQGDLLEQLDKGWDMMIAPHQFGHSEAKRTCLWLKGLPKLKPTKYVEPVYITYASGKKCQHGMLKHGVCLKMSVLLCVAELLRE